MNLTTLFKKREQMLHQPLENCHDGIGALDWVNVLDGDDLASKRLNFLHDDILPPGVSIGSHQHTDDEEYYYIISGCGVMTLNDEQFAVNAGDITAVYPGGSHGLVNTGSEDLRIMVVSVKHESNQP